ncbi:hypothetical protein Naga_100660g1 [Nannochloropsis gaditana]|uniref:Uncharacterized protein n=2 Tax=Nannochloropsis gaditana TaxID=72520 RepID=W7TU38_9STRA|nr:hypothetical protein Naga_100660g1 [Nannochloropsis gaditana]
MSLYCHAGQAPGPSSYCLPLPPPSLLFVPPPVMRTSVPSRFPRPLKMKMRDSPRQKHAQWKEDEMELWKARRGISRSFLKPVGMLTRRRDRLTRARMAKGLDPTGGKKEEVKNAVVATALLVAVVTAVARLGGRAAVMSMMGLDILADAGVTGKLTSVLDMVEGMGKAERLLIFFSLWVVAKNLCLDGLALVLGLSSGILFGGVWEGALSSTVCATGASFIGFMLARTYLREQVRKREC